MKKYLYILTVACLAIVSCSKKKDVTPAAHSIRVTANGSDQFNVSLSTLKTTDITPTLADSKTVAAGSSYIYAGSLNPTDQLSLVIQSDAANTVSYTIFDNDKAVISVTGKEIGTHGTISAGYEVPE